MAQFAQRQRGIGGTMPFGNRPPRKPPQTVYILGPNNQLTPVYIRTGITDGHYTAVVGGKLQAGQNIVIGLATSKVEGPPPPGSNRGPMGGGGRGR
jgi:multidrug efflux pump subunit AcrA (membrane-fusion protein)